MKRMKYVFAMLMALALLTTTAVFSMSFAKGSESGPTPVKYTDGDGMYTIRFSLTGENKTGEKLHTPATLSVEDEKAYAIITWDSANYKTLTLDGKTFKSTGDEKNAKFKIPVTVFDEPMTIVMNDTDEYQLTFDKSSISTSMMMGILFGGTALFIIFILVTRYFAKKNAQKRRRI